MNCNTPPISAALLIEDYPVLTEFYRKALRGYYPKVFHAESRAKADALIADRSLNQPFTVAILHERVRCGPEGGQCDGMSLALHLREHHPETKLLYSISLLSSYKIGSIIREINPEAILYRPDVTPFEFNTAIKCLMEGKSYASPSVVPHMRDDIVGNKILDMIDRRILHYLGQGARTKDLPQLIALSLPSIEKRKKYLRHFLDDAGNDYQMIQTARRLGLI